MDKTSKQSDMKNSSVKNKLKEKKKSNDDRVKMFKMKDGKNYDDIYKSSKKDKNKPKKTINLELLTFEQRLALEEKNNQKESIKLLHGGIGGNRVMTFIPNAELNKDKKSQKDIDKEKEVRDHVKERRKLARRATGLKFSRNRFGWNLWKCKCDSIRFIPITRTFQNESRECRERLGWSLCSIRMTIY